MDKMSYSEIVDMAKLMRLKMLEISYNCASSTHLGGGLSMTEMMACLYARILRHDKKNPRWEGRDRFILSKGHGVLGYFSALVSAGIISDEIYNTFQTNESDLIAHPVMNLNLSIESSNGSLGQGLSMAVGIALAAKKKNAAFTTYVLMGDGECNEGSVWEAVMSAGQLHLDNLVAMVDYNKFQSDGVADQIMNLGDLANKFRAFGWDAHDIDGHNIIELVNSLEAPKVEGKPRVIVANTIKGKGVSFMEGNNEWHHNRLTKANFDLAVAEVSNSAITLER
ncbi:transketolase [Polynucleobacter sp. HIN7]|uniref:transketolase n=1 Tax=Polynucleobacter sp. HIN7 TaxID=3047866 RepID=UPI0025724298|nr:transketolase [Polynucleobacter sp. HIN7]